MRDGLALAIYFFAFLAAWQVVSALRTRTRYFRTTAALLRGLRWRHGAAAGLLVLVACSALAINAMLPAGWDIGWMALLGGDLHPALGTSSDPTHLPRPAQALRLVLPVLALLLLPYLVRAEEQFFRRGLQRQHWSSRCARQLAFGAAHMLVGVPVSVAVAIAGAGAGFAAAYGIRFRRTGSQGLAMLECMRWHLAYNLCALAVFLLLLLVTQAGKP